jgi:hypothetical protein
MKSMQKAVSVVLRLIKIHPIQIKIIFSKIQWQFFKKGIKKNLNLQKIFQKAQLEFHNQYYKRIL